MGRKVYTSGRTSSDTALAGTEGKFPDLIGGETMTVRRDPARDRKAQLVLYAFAQDVEAAEGREAAAVWLRDMLELYGLYRVIP